jgi:hypothetical protein
MKTIQWALVVLLQLGWFQGIGQKTFNDPNAESRPAGQFNAIVVTGSIDLFLTQSSAPAIAVSASDVKTRDLITTEIRNNTLYIGFKSNANNFGNKNLRAYVAAVNLNKIEASGACDVKLEGAFKATDLEVRISGSSDFKGEVNASNLKLNGSGSSDFIISGSASNVRIDVSGASDVKGFDLVTDYCDANASGASDINITVNKELKVKASGASDVSYKGSGLIKEVSTSGASDVKKKG